MKLLIIALSNAIALYCAAASGAEVIVSNPWVRATAPGQTIAGAYLKITSATTAYLIGGNSTAAKSVELHAMSLENNVMKMRPLARLELPAGVAVELKPGSYHLMLIDIVHPLVKGDSVPLRLTVEDKGGRRHTVDVKAKVGEPGAMGGPHGTK